jgi:hypothetical protein
VSFTYKMKYQKIGSIVRNATGVPSKPWLSKSQIETLKNVSDVALAIIAVAGITTVALMAPNLVGAIGKMFVSGGRKQTLTLKEKQAKTVRAFYYLKANGYIKMNRKGDDCEVVLTEEGRRKLDRVGFANLKIERAQTWNGRWWQIAADIPTQPHRSAADSFRAKLKAMGFCPLQRTLWFYPFDPREEVERVARHYGIGQYVTAMEIYRMDVEDEKVLKQFFKEKGIL